MYLCANIILQKITMRSKRFILLLFNIILISNIAQATETELSTLLNELDNITRNVENYDNAKKTKINHIKKELTREISDTERYHINNLLFREYESYICDSALFYINENLIYAKRKNLPELIIESSLNKSNVLAKAGLFNETLELLNSIPRHAVPNEQLAHYYQSYSDTYQYLSEYTLGSEYQLHYIDLLLAYRDSTLSVSKPESFIYVSMYPSKLLSEYKTQEALDFLHKELANFNQGTREYSVLASVIAYAYKIAENPLQNRKYLAISAISDIQGSIKENMAMRELAERLYEDNDINRANHYLKKSLEDANFFSARMRNNQSVRMLPFIDTAYQDLQENYQHRLQIGIVIISILVIILILSLVYIFIQVKKISRNNRILRNAKTKLTELNNELSNINSQMEFSNKLLTEANKIKEEYIGQFMDLCSSYISTLERYRKMLYQQATTGNTEELHKLLRSSDIINQSLKTFYTTFDTAFLKIFPNFTEKFNLLLPESAQIILKPGEKLNTELRIYALIRLGINDSNKIAECLRCSITTIYTYRSKMKSKSLFKDDFEEKVLKISSF